MRRLVLLVVGLVLVARVAATVSGGATQAKTRWVITDLGSFGGEQSFTAGINDRGQIVGWSEVGGQEHGVLWQNGKMRDLGTLGGTSSHALGINDRRQIVGWSETTKKLRGQLIRHAVFWKLKRDS